MTRSRNNRILLSLTIAGLLATANIATAGNSIFSRNGIGLTHYMSSIQSVGMGGAGIASVNRATLHYLNPAASSFFAITRFDGSAIVENTRVTISGQRGRFANTNFNSFQAVFPVKTGYGLGIGLQPFSQIAYELAGVVETPSFSAEQILEGSGTVSRAFLSFGGALGSRVVFGLGMDVYFGRIQRSWRLNFLTSGFERTDDILSTYLRGISGNAGTIVRLSDKINVGGVLYLPARLKYTTTISYAFGASTDLEEGNAHLPLRHGYGVAFYPSDKWHLAADVFFEEWGRITPENLFGARTVNTITLAAGAEYTPTLNQNEGIFQRMSYRVGFRTARLPYRDASGAEIQETVVTFGFTLPYYGYRSKIEFGFEYGKRGSLPENVAEETVFRMVVGVTSGERWFQR